MIRHKPSAAGRNCAPPQHQWIQTGTGCLTLGKASLDSIPEAASDNSQDKDKDGYTNVEEFLNGTNPTVFVDYKKPENDVNTLHQEL